MVAADGAWHLPTSVSMRRATRSEYFDYCLDSQTRSSGVHCEILRSLATLHRHTKHSHTRGASPYITSPFECINVAPFMPSRSRTTCLQPSTAGLRPCFGRPRELWVDAVCINQADLKERSPQVLLMSTIYSSARCVNIWLGTPITSEWTRLNRSLHQLKKSPVMY